MIDRSDVGMLPISSLNALEYCPRKFYYQFVQGEMLINEFVLEGTLAHQRVHEAGTHTTAAGEIETTRLYLYSEALHLTGFADVIEERAGVFLPVEYKHGHQGEWLNDHIQLCAQALCLEERIAVQHEIGQHTVQHETGRPPAPIRLANAAGGLAMRPVNAAAHLPTVRQDARRQLPYGSGKTKGEGLPLHIPYGYIFYVGSRRRVKVHFTEQLRARTRETIAQALQVAALGSPPPPLSGKMAARCPKCSLLPLCLPEEVRLLQSKKRT
jgi:CRISPR-associated protein Cas4